MKFKFASNLNPKGDQPKAIKKLTKNIKNDERFNVLLGVTGSGKTYTMARVIENIQKPTLVISHNKTLAAQLYQEFKEFFPENAVHYFVSYYDYYQPEAYIPQTDTYIEKDAKINRLIDQMRHAAVQDLMERNDVIVVASVSCIYNIGSPQAYQRVSLKIKTGQKIKQRDFLAHLVNLQYTRNDISQEPGTFRKRGDSLEIISPTGKEKIRVEFLGDKIEKISILKNTFEIKPTETVSEYQIYPAQFWTTPQDKLSIAIENIKLELQERLSFFKKHHKHLEYERLLKRTNYDLEMLEESGYCHGIENYSRHLEFRKPGEAPFTLLDYFPDDFLIFVDESHITVPQLRAMAETDRARKQVLIDYGFRLPSALDNRPLTFDEFEKKINQIVFISATPGPYELKKIKPKKSKLLVEQIIRPTGLLEPSIEIRPTSNQVNNLIKEIQKQIKNNERTLVITLTKRLAEELTDLLISKGIQTHYLHSEIKTLERPDILNKLRQGIFQVVVGINLLREGLDLPEVSLVAILDADKEGFLRSTTTLIQTMGRASRHPRGRVILYADKITTSMKEAIKEINRRREIQKSYNRQHNITPKPIVKPVREWMFSKKEEINQELGLIKDIKILEKEMIEAADRLDFERAAQIRDLIKKLKSKPSR